LKNPKNCRLGQCDVCADLQVKLTKARGQIHQQLLTKQQKHKADVRLERKKIDELLDRGHTDPENWTCLATDWSNPHLMPHMGNTPKGWLCKKRLKMNVFGIAHPAQNKVILFPYLDHWEHDANLHISFLFCYLRQLREADKLGKNLILQMGHDNKNKWFFGFLSYLVAFGWFDSVEIFYLRPGHSHGIVDSMCFALLGRDARAHFIYWTTDQFWANFVMKAFQRNRRKVELLDPVVVWDTKSWLDDNLCGMQFQSFQRVYLIELEDGSPILRFKKHLLRNTWKGLRNAPENGLQILIETLNVVPQIVAPKELPMEDLENMQNFPQMPETDKRFWQMFEEKQFSETFGMFPEEWLDNFWLKTPIRNSSSSFSSDDDKPETEEERAVHVLNYPHIIPFLELRKNVIVAVYPNEQ
jgi:hypothetical protein